MARQRLLNGLIIGLLLLVLIACTPGIGRISGTVIDAQGEPVSGAMVQVAGNSIVTDEEGKYTIPEVPIGEYSVAVSKVDVGSITTECTVRRDVATICDIVLMPED